MSIAISHVIIAMRLCVLLMLHFVATALAQCIDTNEPGCRLPGEVGFPQRHCVDPTKYWLCAAVGDKAMLRKCEPNTGFDQDRNTCVPWIDWLWKPCVEPPSRPLSWIPCT